MGTYIQHYGILGMKWGRRKSRISSTSSDDHKTVATLRNTKKTHELSNDELKKLTNRLQLEKSYKDLSKREITVGEKYVTGIVLGAVSTVATAYAVKAVKHIVEKSLKLAVEG